MSKTIFFRILEPTGEIQTSTPNQVISNIQKAFGSFPAKLRRENISVLRGLLIGTTSSIQEEEDNEYYQIIQAIEKYGEIEIYAES